MDCKKELKKINILNDGPAPEIISVSQGANSQIAIRWKEYNGANKYTLYRDDIIIATNISMNFFIDKNVENNVTYTYRVQAFIDSCGTELSYPSSGYADDDGYTFLATFKSTNTDVIRFSFSDNCEVDWGDGNWVQYGPGFVDGNPVSESTKCTIRSISHQENLTHSIRFYPKDDVNIFNNFKEITILFSSFVYSAEKICQDLTELQYFFWIVPPEIQNYNYSWANCSSLIKHNFGKLDYTKATSLNYTWYNCSSLSSFPNIELPDINELNNTWAYCTGLTDFPNLNLKNISRLTYTWFHCTGLTDFPSLDISNINSLDGTWRECTGLTRFPILDLFSVDTLTNTWRDCTSLSEYYANIQNVNILNTSNTVRFDGTWSGCTSLEEFPNIDVSRGTSFNFTWSNTGIKNFPNLSFISAESFNATWANSKQLESVQIISNASSNANSYMYTFYGCSNLKCIQEINTTKVPFGIDPNPVQDMFIGCDFLLKPNIAERDLLTNSPGYHFVNNTQCPVIFNDIIKLTLINPTPITLSITGDCWVIYGDTYYQITTGEHQIDTDSTEIFLVSNNLLGLSLNSSDNSSNENFKEIGGISNLIDASNFCKDLINLELVTVSFPECLTYNNAFNNAGTNTNLELTINTSQNCQDWSYCFKNTNIEYKNNIDFYSGINFMECFYGIQNEHLIPINSENGEIFDSMFAETSLICLNEINTINKTSTTDMFLNSNNLLSPNEEDRTLITDTGIHWVNGDNCPSDLPYPPENLIATDDRVDGVYLSWEQSLNANTYNIYRNGNLIRNTVDINFVDRDVVVGAIYEYQVSGLNDHGESKLSNTALGKLLETEIDTVLNFNSNTMNDFYYFYKSHITDEGRLSAGYKC